MRTAACDEEHAYPPFPQRLAAKPKVQQRLHRASPHRTKHATARAICTTDTAQPVQTRSISKKLSQSIRYPNTHTHGVGPRCGAVVHRLFDMHVRTQSTGIIGRVSLDSMLGD